ncbi:MAG: IS1 family transposase [Bacteroidetes bacterium]|nr:IS1 family transposase [Bacteroidota bacterium]MCB9043405.1 IS1 family transposase [Chitinophagales bacterium]
MDREEATSLERLDVEIRISAEWDEFWSYVGKKSNKRWTWYIIERRSGRIIAWENGKRVYLALDSHKLY